MNKRETFTLSAEMIDLEKSVGRVLAEKVKADMDLPPPDCLQTNDFPQILMFFGQFKISPSFINTLICEMVEFK